MTIHINDTEPRYVSVVLFVVLYKVALTFNSGMKFSCLTKVTEQYFPGVLIVVQNRNTLV